MTSGRMKKREMEIKNKEEMEFWDKIFQIAYHHRLDHPTIGARSNEEAAADEADWALEERRKRQ